MTVRPTSEGRQPSFFSEIPQKSQSASIWPSFVQACREPKPQTRGVTPNIRLRHYEVVMETRLVSGTTGQVRVRVNRLAGCVKYSKLGRKVTHESNAQSDGTTVLEKENDSPMTGGPTKRHCVFQLPSTASVIRRSL